MSVYKELITGLESHGGTPTYLDITPQVQSIITKSGIQNGICCVISPHTTCSVFTDEIVQDRDENGDDYLHADLNGILDKIIPPQVSWDQYLYPGEKHFGHMMEWPREELEKWLPGLDKTKLWNADAHLRATVIGSSVTCEVDGGELLLNGNDQGRVFFVDFDRCRVRQRTCRVVVIGE